MARIFGIVCPILILKLIEGVDKRVRLFLLAVLVWNLVDLLDIAIGEPKKNSELVHRHAHTASDAPGMDAGMGPTAPEVPRECGEVENYESGMGTQNLERVAAEVSV